jgi:hypothetical protein
MQLNEEDYQIDIDVLVLVLVQRKKVTDGAPLISYEYLSRMNWFSTWRVSFGFTLVVYLFIFP